MNIRNKLVCTVLIAIFTLAALPTKVVYAEDKISNEKPSLSALLHKSAETDLRIVLEPIIKPEQPPEPPKPIEYVVVDGDHLTKIAEVNQTTWLRIWQKNTNLTNPDLIQVGDKLVIPTAEEKLEERALPEVLPAPVPVSSPSMRSVANNATSASRSVSRGSSSGNTYTYGYCTWYVKNRRPDLPNNLGNADTWTVRARNQGIPTGSSPRAGAVGQKGMHVVYVESVNGDGTMTISEYNYTAWDTYSSRTISPAGWNFIY